MERELKISENAYPLKFSNVEDLKEINITTSDTHWQYQTLYTLSFLYDSYH